MTEPKPRCSIIVPVRHRRSRVLQTLRTIQAQTCHDVEIVVCVDEAAAGVNEAIEALHDDRIVVVRSDSGSGLAETLNLGVEASTGDYLGFCDDGDYWTPDKVEGQLEKISETGNLWSFSHVVKIDDSFNYRGRIAPVLAGDFFERLLYSNQVPGGFSAVICERRTFEKAGRFDALFLMFADWDMWIRLCEQSPPAIWEEVGTLQTCQNSKVYIDVSKVRPELAAFNQNHSAQRSKYSVRSLESIDRWIIRQLWESGQRRQAIWYRVVCDSSVGFRNFLRSAFYVATRQFREQDRHIDLAAEQTIGLVRNIVSQSPDGCSIKGERPVVPK